MINTKEIVGCNHFHNGLTIPSKRVCKISIVRHSPRTEIGSAVQDCSLWEQNFVFSAIL